MSDTVTLDTTQAYLSKRGFSTLAGSAATCSSPMPTLSAATTNSLHVHARSSACNGHRHSTTSTPNSSSGAATHAVPRQGQPGDEALELFADAVVLGSGAGGGAAAAVLAAAGMKVLVVEKSTWRRLSGEQQLMQCETDDRRQADACP